MLHRASECKHSVLAGEPEWLHREMVFELGPGKRTETRNVGYKAFQISPEQCEPRHRDEIYWVEV